MNYRQKQIICTALFLLTVFVLFPPWVYENGQTSAQYSAGYYFLFNSPKIKSDTEMRKQLSIPDNVPVSFHAQRDLARFTAQIMAVPFLAIGFLLTLANKKSLEKTILGSISIFIGILFAALVCFLSWR